MIHTGTVEKFNASIKIPIVGDCTLFGVDNGNGRYVKVLAHCEKAARKIAKQFLKAIGEETTIHQVDKLSQERQVVGIESY